MLQTFDHDEDVCYSTRTVSQVCDSTLVAVRFVYFWTESIVSVRFESVFGRSIVIHLTLLYDVDDDDGSVVVESFYLYSMQTMDLSLI